MRKRRQQLQFHAHRDNEVVTEHGALTAFPGTINVSLAMIPAFRAQRAVIPQILRRQSADRAQRSRITLRRLRLRPPGRIAHVMPTVFSVKRYATRVWLASTSTAVLAPSVPKVFIRMPLAYSLDALPAPPGAGVLTKATKPRRSATSARVTGIPVDYLSRSMKRLVSAKRAFTETTASLVQILWKAARTAQGGRTGALEVVCSLFKQDFGARRTTACFNDALTPRPA